MKAPAIIACLLISVLGLGVWLATSPTLEHYDQDLIADLSRAADRVIPAQHYGPDDTSTAHLIAVIAERSGRSGPQNEPMYAAVRYAVDEINQAGGILGQPLRLIEYDNMTDPLAAIEAAQLAVEAKVLAVIGSSRSSNSLAMAPVLQESQIVMISPESTNPQVTQVGNYIFRSCFIDPFQAKVLANFAIDHLQCATAVTITCANRIFSEGLSEQFHQVFTQRGGTVLENCSYLESAAEFEPIIARLTELQPDVVFLPSEVRDTSLIMTQAHAAGLDCLWIGPDSWNTKLLTHGGPAAQQAFFSSHWHRDNPASSAFVNRYEQRVAPITRAGIAMYYDTVHLLADAIKRAQGQGGEQLRQALQASDFHGITGNIQFDAQGDPIAKQAVILRLDQHGEHFVTTQAP